MTDLVLEVFHLNGGLLTAGDLLGGNLELTSARWRVRGAIALSPVPLPVAHPARTMGLVRQSVQRLVDEMKKNGLVRHAPGQHHRWAMPVLLTKASESAYRVAMLRQERWADRLTAGFSGRGHRDRDGHLARAPMSPRRQRGQGETEASTTNNRSRA